MTLGFRTALALLVTTPVLAADPPVKNVSWLEGDYGPVMSVPIDVAEHVLQDTTDPADTRNYVYRGRLIVLNDERSANAVFDTELMRWAGFWTGGYVKFGGAFKNMGPSVDGALQFTTTPRPGWSRDGSWEDPRDPKEGPLPGELAKYRGLHLHGRKVVLDYTVGDARVLEMPAVETAAEQEVFVRHVTMGPSSEPLRMLLAEEAAESAAVSPSRVVSKVDGGFLVASGSSLPRGARFEADADRVVLALPPLGEPVSFRVHVARVPAGKIDAVVSAVNGEALDLTTLTSGGPPRWTTVVETEGQLAEDVDEPYVVDTLTPPDDNPWRSWMRFGAFDFFEDGRAAICTWDGDVWIVSGIDDDLKALQWRRFATGLHQPLGLKIVDGVIHTAGRDQVTRLHDRNGDGEADWYECVNNEPGLTLQRHEYVMDLETDAEGNLYYCRSGHYVASQRGQNCCVYKLSPDGSKLEIVASGFREPNGLSIAPDGFMTVADNEGNGIPQTPLYQLKPGAFYGFTPPDRAGNRREGQWEPTQAPIVWLPKQVDQSAGGQVWVTSDRWGPLKGHLLHTSYGHCKLFHVMLDRVGETVQGAAWEFPLRFDSGIMRGRFRDRDGQLYLCGLRGWGTSAAKETQFCRVRSTGKPFRQPVGFEVTDVGLEITFGETLEPKSAEDFQNWAVTWSDAYKVPGRDRVREEEPFVEFLELSEDGRTVAIELEEIKPVTNLVVEYRIRSADGQPVRGKLHGTVNAVPATD